jgi:hypothetical protein
MVGQALLNVVAELRVVELTGAMGGGTSGDPVEVRKSVEIWQRQMELRERKLALREAKLVQREKNRELESRRAQETRALNEAAHFREEER